MKKTLLLLLVFLVTHLFTAAQSIKPIITADPFEWHWRELGGQLNMHYDGERLRFHLVAQFPDTNILARAFIKKKNDGHWISSDVGRMKIGDREVKISISSSEMSYEIHDHMAYLSLYARDIPCVVNGAESLDVLMTDFSPDSAVFICTGGEHIQQAKPEPVSQTSKQVNWIATDTSRLKRHSEYAVVLESSDKGAFGFSRLSLRHTNSLLSLFWDHVTTFLLMLVSFWYLWYWLVAGRACFNRVDPKLVNCMTKWIPWFTGFYLVLILDHIVIGSFAMAFINMGKTMKLPATDTWRWRTGLTVAAAGLLIFLIYWRRGNRTPWIMLIRTLGRTVAYSMIVFVALGICIQFIEYYAGLNTAHASGGYVSLNVSGRFAIWAVVACYAYLAFVLYKLFAFNRFIQIMVISLMLLFAPKESHSLLVQAEPQMHEHGMTIEGKIEDAGETDEGTLHLAVSFINQCNMFSGIPLLVALYLLVKVSRRKDQSRASVFMVSLFFVFYCYCITDIRETFLLFPVTLVAAIFLNRFIIVRSGFRRYRLLETGNQLYSRELNDIQVFKKMPELRKSVRLKEIYRQRMLNAKLLPADYNQAVADIDRLVGEPGSENIQRRLEFGPYREPLRNGLLGLGYSLLVSALIYTVYFKFYLIGSYYKIHGIPEVFWGDATNLAIKHLAPIGIHGLAGFCLGYYFPFVRGNSGWEKGAWLGAAMGLAHLPLVYFTVEDAGWAPLAGIFFKHVIILMITGFLACDLATIRKIYGRRYSWKDVVHMMGWKRTLTFGASVTTAIGSGITSWISEGVLEALKSFLVN
jgi:hypothetical protein